MDTPGTQTPGPQKPGIVITGVSGRMGRMLVREVLASDACRLVGALERPGHDWVGRDLGAALGGADTVKNVDLSRKVLAWGQENYARNGLAAPDTDFLYGDVFEWLSRLQRRGDVFDLVVLDVGLPDTDGRELCKRLRKQGVKCPVVMLTGHAAQSDSPTCACTRASAPCTAAGLPPP